MHWQEGSPGLLCSRVNLLAQAISPIEAVNHTYHHIPGMPAPPRQCTGTCLLPPDTQRGNSVPQPEISTDMLSYQPTRNGGPERARSSVSSNSPTPQRGLPTIHEGLMVVCASTSLGHQHPQVHLPWSTSMLLVPSAPMTSLTSLSQAFPARGWVFCSPPNQGAWHWTLWKSNSLLAMHEEIASYLLLQECLKVFYPVNSRSLERTCGMDYTDPFRALNIFK